MGEWVRIPLSPQSLNKPRVSGVVYFNEVLKKACFLKEQRENKQNPSGFIQALQGSSPGITEGNPPLSATTNYSLSEAGGFLFSDYRTRFNE
jgi:hypothetical protein